MCVCVSSLNLWQAPGGVLLLPPLPQLECAKVGLHSLKFHLALISCGQGWSTLGQLWSNLVYKKTGWWAIWPPRTQGLCLGLTGSGTQPLSLCGWSRITQVTVSVIVLENCIYNADSFGLMKFWITPKPTFNVLEKSQWSKNLLFCNLGEPTL